MVEEALNQINLDYPVVANDLAMELAATDVPYKAIEALRLLRPDYIFEDRLQIIDLFEDPGSLAAEAEDAIYGGHTADLFFEQDEDYS